MAKNLKVNIKNTQLAEALKINKIVRKKPAQEKSHEASDEAAPIAAAPVESKAPVVAAPSAPVFVEAPQRREETPEPIVHKTFEPQEAAEKPASKWEEPSQRPQADSFRQPDARKEDGGFRSSDNRFTPQARQPGTDSYQGQQRYGANRDGNTAYPPRTNTPGTYTPRPQGAGGYNQRPPQGSYTPRPPQGNSYEQRPQGSYTPRPQGSEGYTPRPPQGNSYEQRPQGSYTPRPQGSEGHTPRPPQGNSYEQRPQGSYTPRPQGSYTPRPPQGNSYEQRPQGTYTPRPQGAGGYPPRPPQGNSYEQRPQGSYTPRPPQGNSYEQRPQGSYTPRPQGSYTPRPQGAGGYTPRPQGSGYTPRPQGSGYPDRGPPGQGRDYPPRTNTYGSPRPGGYQGGGYRPSLPRDVGPSLPAMEKENSKDPNSLKKIIKKPGTDEEEGAKKVATHQNFRDTTKKKVEVYKSFDGRDRQGLRADSAEEEWRKKRNFKSKNYIQQEEIIRPKKLAVRLPTTVKDLANAMKLKASQLIAKLFMQGVVLTLNDVLDDETTLQLLGQEFDCEITIDTKEADRIKITDKTIKEEISETPSEELILRPPVVTFMGHVDHGKTSLIDKIRSSNVAAGEAGAITQHIGAFQCQTSVGKITILDTPGHEAFFEMRSRGAEVTDIVVLVIAGDEGMKAQTIEAMKQALEAKVPIVVAINKCDKPNFDVETVYRQLADQNLLPEAWGGSIITVNCSAITGEGVNSLLEMLALQSEVMELKASPIARARGSVIESEMHKGHGSIATILVQNGTLKLGDSLVVGEHFARVKTMHDELDNLLQEAGPSTPVKVTGLSGLPLAGSEFVVVKNEKEARDLSQKRAEGQKQTLMHAKRGSFESILQNRAEGTVKKVLPLILKADVQGSLEALKTSLMKIETKKVELNIISGGVGEISESDIQLAAASKAAIIGFHTGIESHAQPLIREHKVNVILNDIIYHLADEVKELMLATLDTISQEVDTGKAEVKAVFKASSIGVISGCIMLDSTIKRSNHIRVIRNGEMVHKGPITSLKRGKDDVREVAKGFECGILIQGYNDTQVGDILQAYEIIHLKQQL